MKLFFCCLPPLVSLLDPAFAGFANYKSAAQDRTANVTFGNSTQSAVYV